jgi:hypothetical protein
VLKKIISGGQTGADRTALELAKEFGFETGGFAPKGYLTETGPDTSLRGLFGLQEARYKDYPYRTRLNIEAADMTVIYGRMISGGSRLTEELCEKVGSFYMVNPTSDELIKEILEQQYTTINVAGNRLSKNPGIVKHVQDRLIPVLIHFRSLRPAENGCKS